MAARVVQVRFHINWQWPAVKMQYERLIARSSLTVGQMPAEHMRMVADMDFLVTSLRRFLRTAELARQIPSEHQPQLKLALSIFNSRWWSTLKAVRDALEHFDTTAMFPAPAVGIPASGSGEGHFVFMWPRGNLDIGKLYEDAEPIKKAIVSIIGPIEAQRDVRKLDEDEDEMKPWEQYQEDTAELLRELGFTAVVNDSLAEPNGTVHEVDVSARRTLAGVDLLWVVECKLWRTQSVTIEKVAALKAIVDWVGADRGLLMSEGGFQSGAIRMAMQKNITLSSMADLRESAAEELLASG